jgi:hypothetical protein
MKIYEKRTYAIKVGQMAEVTRLYTNEGWPALEAGGFAENLVGYFISDTGPLHSLIHIWRFENDEARRAHWKRLFENKDFMAFGAQFRPHILSQEIQQMTSAPWGPHP